MDIVVPDLKKRVDLQLFKRGLYFSMKPASKTSLLLVVPPNGFLNILIGFRFNFSLKSGQSN